MVRPFDVSKFRKAITKSVAGVSVGFSDPTTWVSTGNYCLNYRISGDFWKGIPMSKVTVFAGESGSGKSFIVSGNLVREAQKQGIFVVMIDSENALDEAWLRALGVETDESKLLKLNVAMIDEVGKIISDFMKDYKSTYADATKEERPKVMFVIDSLGMLMTPTEVNQFEAGDMKGDMGRKAKQLKALVINCVNMFGAWDIGMVCTNHTYASQDMFNPDDVVSGGAGFVYASSILVSMKKLKLKTDEDGNKTTTVNGIRAKCKVMKTRFNKPFEEVEIKIPWNTGMDPYSGIFTMAESLGLISKSGNRWLYKTLDGQEFLKYEKEYNRNEGNVLDAIMKDVMARDATAPAETRTAFELMEEEAIVLEESDA